MRLPPPDGGLTFFDHQPELFAAFNRLYGTLWSLGVVDQPTKEVGRLRNARVTGCNICKNLRFSGAKEQGLTEGIVDQIDDGYADSVLSERFQLVIRYTDAIVGDPHGIDDEMRAALRAEFRPAELVELTATISLAMGFSKAAVAWGPPPDIPLIEVPTPTPDGSVDSPLD
jgi:alkylhydroperoxidase family enzyme